MNDDDNSDNNNNYNGWKLQSTFKVLQKPSVNEMMSMTNPPCVFNTTTTTNNAKDGDDITTMAWIDTGVITFLPDAVETLREMSNAVLKNCTRVGLMELYLEKHGDDDGSK